MVGSAVSKWLMDVKRKLTRAVSTGRLRDLSYLGDKQRRGQSQGATQTRQQSAKSPSTSTDHNNINATSGWHFSFWIEMNHDELRKLAISVSHDVNIYGYPSDSRHWKASKEWR